MKKTVLEVVPSPRGKSMVGLRWIYKVKHAVDGSIKKYKAKFVAKGFSQVEGVDYEETFAPVTIYSSIRFIIALVVQMRWKIHKMDVKVTFLNGVVEEEAYIEHLEGCMTYE